MARGTAPRRPQAPERQRRRARQVATLLALLALTACGETPAQGPAPVAPSDAAADGADVAVAEDAGADAAADATADAVPDAALDLDAAADAGPPPDGEADTAAETVAQPDAEPDAEPDAGTDADAAPDGAPDAAADVDTDASPEPDAAADVAACQSAGDCPVAGPCQQAQCNDGACVAVPAADGPGCDDGDACTQADACTGGACVGQPLACDDGNPCTDDACLAGACQATPNAVACDDGNACTEIAQCKDGACQPGSAIACDDKNPCTTDSCNADSGTCQFEPNALPCDDGAPCTASDGCKGGTCAGVPKDCTDGKSCTIDNCDDATGACTYFTFADFAVCDDGSDCTQNDVCLGGACSGTPLQCDDGNPCTADPCDAKAGCTSTANQAACDDGNACTGNDACQAGKCVAGAAASCDDGNPCTQDSCDVAKGCQHMAVTGGCSDGDACTEGDACQNGACVGKAKVCTDGNGCTDDVCDAKAGCQFPVNTAACSDGSACTAGDACSAGKCVAGAPVACDDGNPCTTDTCAAATGCGAKPLADKTACDDGNGCTVGDACKTAKCQGAGKNCDDGNPCTTDSCKADVCTHTNHTGACSDGNTCTQTDACDGKGACVGGNPTKCDDGNPCTDDACVHLKGCVFTANTASCDDGQFCTVLDACQGGKCAGGTPKPCDDGNACTADTCQPALQKCVGTPVSQPCDDGDKCTLGDFCKDGACQAGKPNTCDDGNGCTADACTKTGQCTHSLLSGEGACQALPVPLLLPIDHDDPLWTQVSTGASVRWQADATPATPGKLSGQASLNFNNGTDFAQGGAAVSGQAVGKFFVDATAAKGALTFAFFSWADVEASQAADKRFVELSTDGFATVAQAFQLDNTANAKQWYQEALDISALAGQSFQVRFRFDSVSGAANTGKGWFVDEINVYAGPVVTLQPGQPWLDGFDGNGNGWQFSAPAAGSAWAIDATPATPAALSPPTSLNFNNGKDFAGNTSGWALSPVLDLTQQQGHVTLIWKEWADVGTSDSYDRRFLQVSVDGFQTVALADKQANAAKYQDGWRWQTLSLSAYKGKRIRVRFHFDSVTTANNDGAGWFVDDLRLDDLPLPLFHDLVTAANASQWTVAKSGGSGAAWAVDATGGLPHSADAALNFNGLKANGSYDYACLSGNKVGGTASASFVLPKNSGKVWLTFMARIDTRPGPQVDKLTVLAKPYFSTTKQFPVDKAQAYQQWAPVAIDLTGVSGPLSNYPTTLSFQFDSVDCAMPPGLGGVFIDDVMVRAEK